MKLYMATQSVGCASSYKYVNESYATEHVQDQDTRKPLSQRGPARFDNNANGGAPRHRPDRDRRK